MRRSRQGFHRKISGTAGKFPTPSVRTSLSSRAARIRGGAILLLGALCFPSPCAAADPVRLEVRILDENGAVTPARAWIDSGENRLFEPAGPGTVTPYARDRSFSCDGEFAMLVPGGGEVIVHIEKGKEYRPVDLAVPVPDSGNVDRTIRLERWADMAALGWYSADLHVHLGQDDPRILRQLALADDLNLVPSFTYWLRGRGETWNAAWPDPSYREPIVIDPSHLVTRNHIEVERINRASVPGGYPGATFLYNLEKPVTAAENGEHFPTDASLCRAARTHSPALVVDCDKPSWAATAVTAGLGELDTVQLCHNHFHRESTLDGGWGMIGPLAEGESNAAADDRLFRRTNAIYYRLLNCGFRLGVSGGSAIGVMPVAAGHHRVYARIEGAFTAEKFWEALRAGRSFATSGPMLDLAADGQPIGSLLARRGGDETAVALTASLRSIDPIESLQIIHNGDVVAVREDLPSPGAGVLETSLDAALVPKRSGWVAARAFFRAPDGRLRQAHTSPIYLDVDGRPAVFAEDARYMIRWIEVLEEIARTHPERFPTEEAREGVLSDYAEAKNTYTAVLRQAEDAGRRPAPAD